jgi:hypothetical protein
MKTRCEITCDADKYYAYYFKPYKPFWGFGLVTKERRYLVTTLDSYTRKQMFYFHSYEEAVRALEEELFSEVQPKPITEELFL